MPGVQYDPEISKAIGFRIRNFRRKIGMNQEKLADKLSLSRVQISNIEVGRSATSVGNIPALCHALGVTPNQIFGWDADE
jgi:transcriptional regulator with XRE-family HTH domain